MRLKYVLPVLMGAALLFAAACDDDETTTTDGGHSDGAAGAGGGAGSKGDAAIVDATSVDSTSDAPATDGPVTDAAIDAASSDGAIGDGAIGDGAIGDGAISDGAAADAPVLNDQQKRGQYLVDHVIGCPDCHTPRKMDGTLDLTKYMAGDPTPAPSCLFKAPGASTDCLYPRNLTNDVTGLKNRTDAEIKRAFTQGLRPVDTQVDGGPAEEALFPVMPYYVFHNMADDDANAIVAYLRTIPAVDQRIPRRGAFFDIPAPVPALDTTKIPAPSPTYANLPAATKGKYLATQAGLCIECHSPHLPMGPTALDETKLFWGGEDFTGILGPTTPIKSKNLTPDVATGIGSWTIPQIVAAIKMGKDKDGKGICPPMPYPLYAGMTDDDATNIANYLLSIAPATNMVPDMCTFPPGM